MARPIKETPILFGKDARRFEERMKEQRTVPQERYICDNTSPPNTRAKTTCPNLTIRKVPTSLSFLSIS